MYEQDRSSGRGVSVVVSDAERETIGGFDVRAIHRVVVPGVVRNISGNTGVSGRTGRGGRVERFLPGDHVRPSMSVREEFDAWAERGRDRGMEQRHWNTAKHVLARMPVEDGETVLDLGCGSGYAGRALRANTGVERVYGLDGAPKMAHNAAEYTDDPAVCYLVGDFEYLPLADGSVDHVFTMEAFYYAADPIAALEEIRRVLRPGGTFYCAVNFYEENVHSHEWDENMDIEMARWTRGEYRTAFREAGLFVAEQDNVPDREVTIPPAEQFPTEEFDTREAMIERYRTYGTLLTVGVAP
jgi:ubiquinone/menaquinone biosynthesis C-methylase UbiE